MSDDARGDCLRAYCSAARDLKTYCETKREESRYFREARTAAYSLLQERLYKDGVNHTYLAAIEGVPYGIRRKTVATPSPVTLANVCSALELWKAPDEGAETGGNIRSMILASEGEVQGALADAITTVTAGETRCTEKVEILPYKARKGEDEPRGVPDELHELMVTLVHAREQVARIGREAKDEKTVRQERYKAAEEKVLREFEEEGTGTLRRINIKDSVSGTAESYFVRMKPPRRPMRKKMPAKLYRKSVKDAVMQTLNAFAIGEAGITRQIEVISTQEFGEELVGRIQALVEAHEVKSVKGTNQRVALDRVRMTVKH